MEDTTLTDALNRPGKFRVYVSTTNYVYIDIDAESSDDAEKIVKKYIKQNDDRFYNSFSGPFDGDDFDIDSVSADIHPDVFSDD